MRLWRHSRAELLRRSHGYMSRRDCDRLQKMPDLRRLPRQEGHWRLQAAGAGDAAAGRGEKTAREESQREARRQEVALAVESAVLAALTRRIERDIRGKRRFKRAYVRNATSADYLPRPSGGSV
jgi:hypothetical protein